MSETTETTEECGRFYARPYPLDYEFCYQPKGHSGPCLWEPRRRTPYPVGAGIPAPGVYSEEQARQVKPPSGLKPEQEDYRTELRALRDEWLSAGMTEEEWSKTLDGQRLAFLDAWDDLLAKLDAEYGERMRRTLLRAAAIVGRASLALDRALRR
jgi:hypothetical protein